MEQGNTALIEPQKVEIGEPANVGVGLPWMGGAVSVAPFLSSSESDDPFDDFEDDDFDDEFDDDFEEDWEDDLTEDEEFPDTFGGDKDGEGKGDSKSKSPKSPFSDDPDFDTA